MLNYLLDLIRRSSSGDGPVPKEHAESYAERGWATAAEDDVVARIAAKVGGLRGKRVLDLGGGPGAYSVGFARLGADVVWHDISRHYLEIAKRKASEHGVKLGYSLGYLEDARRLGKGSFDVLFNRVCWNYARADRPFAKMVVGLLKPGGLGYINTHNEKRLDRGAPWYHRLYRRFGIKIGHPFPNAGAVERLLRESGARILETDYSQPENDCVYFTVDPA